MVCFSLCGLQYSNSLGLSFYINDSVGHHKVDLSSTQHATLTVNIPYCTHAALQWSNQISPFTILSGKNDSVRFLITSLAAVKKNSVSLDCIPFGRIEIFAHCLQADCEDPMKSLYQPTTYA